MSIENGKTSNNEFILTGTILGQEDKNKVIEKMRKQYAKRDDLAKMSFELATKDTKQRSFDSANELQQFLETHTQQYIKQYDPINMMATFEEAEEDENKIISPDMASDFEKIVPTQSNDASIRYDDITRIDDYIKFAKTRSESFEKQMKSQKKILADLKTEQEKCKKTYQNFNQKLQKANQAFITAFQKCKTTSAILNNARTENNPTAITKAREQLKKDIVVAHKMKQQRDNLSTQLNAVQTAYTIATRTHNNILKEYNSNEDNKKLADKLVEKYSDVAKNLKQQRENILQQASKDAKDTISAMDSVGKQMNPEARSRTFQTHLFIETQKIYDYYLNLRKKNNATLTNAKQKQNTLKQQELELQKIDKQIAENRQQIQQSITYEPSLIAKINQAKEDLSKNKNPNEQQLQTYSKMSEEYRQLKQKYHTLTNQNQQLEEQRARLKYDLQPESQKQQTTALQEEKELQAFLDAPTEEEKQSAQIQAYQAEHKEWLKNFYNSQQKKYTYEAYIQNKKKSEASNSLNTNLQPQIQQQKQNVENKPFNNYFYRRQYYSNYLKSTPSSSKSTTQQSINTSSKHSIYNRYMPAYLKLNNQQPQVNLQQYHKYRILRGQNNNLNINIQPQTKGAQPNYFQSYRSYLSRITSKGTSNGWIR